MRRNWINIFFLSTTALASLTAVPYWFAVNGWSWSLVGLTLVFGFMTNISITAGYHRYLAHRSYESNTPLKLLYLLIGAAAFQGSALEWATDHRRHHRHVDTDKDPHNIRNGFFWAHMGWLFYKETAERRGPIPHDLKGDALIVWQDKYYVWIALAMGFGLPTLIGWSFGSALGGFLFGGVLRTFLTNHCTFFINSLAHTVGTKPYSDKQTARDSVLMAVLACGEGYHNFHHQFASDYRNGIRWWQYDPTKWLIRGLSFVGWTRRLKTVPSSEILYARMRAEQHRLIIRGVPTDRVQALKQRVEEAQKRWRAVYDDYKARKAELKIQSWELLVQKKAELKVAKLEFKLACRQWVAYYKTMRALPAIA